VKPHEFDYKNWQVEAALEKDLFMKYAQAPERQRSRRLQSLSTLLSIAQANPALAQAYLAENANDPQVQTLAALYGYQLPEASAPAGPPSPPPAQEGTSGQLPPGWEYSPEVEEEKVVI